MLLGVSQWHSILINDSKHQKKALMLGNVARYINIQHNFYTFLKWIIIILVLMKVEHFSFGRDRKVEVVLGISGLDILHLPSGSNMLGV